jgi:hypothetical protein
MDVENFLIYGFSYIENINIFDFIKKEELNGVNLPGPYSPVEEYPPSWILKKIEPLGDLIFDVMEKNFGKVKKIGTNPIIEGVEKTTTMWHNDSQEGFNCNVLCYIDNMNEHSGGHFHIKSYTTENTIIPKSGTILAINQSKRFLHRVDYTEKLRRRIEFKFTLPL